MPGDSGNTVMGAFPMVQGDAALLSVQPSVDVVIDVHSIAQLQIALAHNLHIISYYARYQ